MSDSKHEMLRRLFEGALELPVPERAAFLGAHCGADAELRRRLEAMLAAAEDDHFLSSPSDPALAEAATEAEGALREGPGTRIGPYKLLEQIGEGGFGVVFMAEQEKPVARKVALKIIKLGMDTRQVVARFEQERQALALMEHPNIARVIDAGATETGRPYFVMELVKGEPIAAYCDRNNLSIEERLGVFAQVCGAIQHAHQKGIIHRDLKPSNILVGTQDGRPIAKVIDFGIAKATTQKLTDKTLFTEHKQVIGTFQYMSPEQAEGSLDLDTRTDVYSLGVVLYELLTGTTPFDTATLRDAMYSEIQRMIREVDPPRPSTRISASNEALASIAARRRIEPARLGKLVRGELDWIVMKALEKDRARRYDSPSGLAQDLDRYLAGEAVVAAPPSAAYRARKFVARHRGQVLAASLILLTLVGGIVGTSIGMVRASRAAAEEARAKVVAETNLAYAQKGNEILGSVFSGLDPKANYGTVAELRNALRDNLDASAAALDGAAIGDTLVVAQMQARLGQALNALGEAQAAVELYAKAVATYVTVSGPDHPDTLTNQNNLAMCEVAAGKLDAGLARLEDTLARRRRTLGAEAEDTLSSLASLAGTYVEAGKLDRALPLLEESRTLHEKVFGRKRVETMRSMNDLAAGYRAAGRIDDALPLFEAANAVALEKLGPEHPLSLATMGNLGDLYAQKGDRERAVEMLEKTLALRRARLGPDHPETLSTINNLASQYQTSGNLERALPLLEDARRILTARYGADHPNTLIVSQNLAACYRETKRLDEAVELLEETLRLQKAKLGADHPNTLVAAGTLAATYWSMKKLDRSIPLFEETLAAQEKKLGRKHRSTQATLQNLGVNYRSAGRYAEALPVLEEAYPNVGLWGDTVQAGFELLDVYIHCGKAEQAAELTADLATEIRSKNANDDAKLASRLSTLGRVLLDAGSCVEAEPFLRESLALREKQGSESWGTFANQSMLGGALLGQRKYADAEPLLLAGYEGLRRVEAKIPESNRARLTEAIERLARLHTETDRPDEAAKWQAILSDQAKAGPAAAK